MHFKRDDDPNWTMREVSGGQVLDGQYRFSQLEEETTYQFKLQAKGNGVTTAAGWSDRYSFVILVHTGPPPAPTGLAVRSKTETSVKLEYHTVMGATYEVEHEEAGAGTRDARNDEVPGSTSGLAIHTVTGLDEGTEYEFRVRATGDGSRWTNEARDWSDTVSSRTMGYTAAIPAPSLSPQCAGLLGTTRSPEESNPVTPYTAPDGSTHHATTELWGRLIDEEIFPNYPNYCVQGRYISTSLPGADTISWSGSLFYTVSSTTPSDVANLDSLTLESFNALYDAQRPTTSDAPVRTVIYSCPGPCKGGTLQTEEVILKRKYLKVPAAYLYGTYTFTIDGQRHPMNSNTDGEAPPAGDLRDSLTCIMTRIGQELAEDLAPDLVETVLDWLEPLC